MNGSSTQITYSVPSQSDPTVRYAVTLREGQVCCNCPWGRGRRENHHICWHARLVRLVERTAVSADLRHAVTRESHEQARIGALPQQLYIVMCVLDIMLERPSYAAASRCAETLSKYLRALSFAGAEPACVEVPPAVETEEEARLASLSRRLAALYTA
jgi:hypothetical protein